MAEFRREGSLRLGGGVSEVSRLMKVSDQI